MKVKAQMGLNLAQNVKNYKKSFCKYIEDKRMTGENVHPLVSEVGDPVTQTMEKAEVPNTFSTSAFTSKMSLQESQRRGGRSEQGRCTLGGEGSGQRVLKQTGHLEVHGP